MCLNTLQTSELILSKLIISNAILTYFSIGPSINYNLTAKLFSCCSPVYNNFEMDSPNPSVKITAYIWCTRTLLGPKLYCDFQHKREGELQFYYSHCQPYAYMRHKVVLYDTAIHYGTLNKKFTLWVITLQYFLFTLCFQFRNHRHITIVDLDL